MVDTLDLNEASARNVLGEIAPVFGGNDRVTRPMDDEGRHRESGEHATDIDLEDHFADVGHRPRGSRVPLQAPESFVGSFIVLGARKEQRNKGAIAP